MTDYPVSNDSQFSSARSAAGAGDTITLANGTYAGFTWAKNVGSSHGLLTIQAANPGQATISSRLTLNNCSGLKFTGVNIPQGYERGFGTNAYLTFEYGQIGSMHRLSAATQCIVQYCEIIGAYINIDQTSSYITFQENYIRNSQGDTANCTGAAHHIDWLNNVIFDMYSSDAGSDPHWDLGLQMFSVSGVAPSDFNIRGNIIIDDPATKILRTNGSEAESQGIFCGNGGGTYLNGVIEQNMVWVQNSNGIRFSNTGTGCVIRNNSLINGTICVNQQSSSFPYSLPITDNITGTIVIDTPESGGGLPTQSGNIVFSVATDAYEDPGTTNGVLDYRRFIPKAAYSSKGAATRIAEIQAGTNVYALELAGMAAVGDGSSVVTKTNASPAGIAMTGYPATVESVGAPPPSISRLTINLASV